MTESEILHYAACNDCKLYKYVDDEDTAEERAEFHSEEFDHDAYSGRTELVA